MAPRPVFKGPQNGLHTHLSFDPLPSQADSFIQGILDHLKTLCALSMPNVDSYVRVTDDGAGCCIGWGTECRDLPIRKITDNHWELRFIDATANLYIFMAALLHAGLDAMRKRKELTYKDGQCFREGMGWEKLKDMGIREKMPESLQETVSALKNNALVTRCLNERLVSEYIQVNEKEMEKFEGTTDKERRIKF